VDNQLSVVIADDAVLMREALASLLARDGFTVAAQAGDADELHRAVARVRPDVVVVDVRMPPEHRFEGLHAAVRIRREYSGTGVVVLSQHVETHYLSTLMAGGARGVGYLLKERVAGIDAFLTAVRQVAAGGCVVDQQVVHRMLGGQRRAAAMANLSEREREILSLIAQGRSNQAICRQLVLTKKTVESHVRSILLRLDLPPEPDDHRRVLAVLSYLGPWSEQAYRAGLPTAQQAQQLGS
jgi:DNA-binding NarL/FixJ family response regulator